MVLAEVEKPCLIASIRQDMVDVSERRARKLNTVAAVAPIRLKATIGPSRLAVDICKLYQSLLTTS